MFGQVLFHPSYLCQIGAADQGLIVWPSNPQPLPHKVDTNLVENMIRPTKLGAKNSIFFGSLDAGTNNALFYTLMANCKNHGLDPEMYLTEVINRLPHHATVEQAAELTPARFAVALRAQAQEVA